MKEIEEYKSGKFPTLKIEGFVLDKDEKSYFPLDVTYMSTNARQLDKGHLVITNERILFIGNKGTRDYI